MLSRVARFNEVRSVEAVCWPSLTTAGTDPADAGELEEVRRTLTATVEELRLARCRIAELEAARAEAEAAAHRKGIAEGTQAARQTAAEEQTVLLERISRSVADVAGMRMRIRRDAETDLVKLALAIARRITHREMSVDPQALLGVVRAALSRVPASDLTKVRLHPSSVPVVRFQLESLRIPSTVEIEPDTTLQPGDLLLETTSGTLDASIDTQFKEIERGFCDHLQS